MAGNAGHPFFGNQYVSSSYTGGYHYDWIPNSNVTEVFTRSAKKLSDNISSVPSIAAHHKSANKILPRAYIIGESGKGAMIAVVVVSAIAAIGTGAYFLYKHINKKHKLKEEALQAIELENVGACKYCGEPLSGSEYVGKNTSNSDASYIICKQCGEKNYAWYADDENGQEHSK